MLPEIPSQIGRESHNHRPDACQDITLGLLNIMEDTDSLFISPKATDSGIYSASLRQYSGQIKRHEFTLCSINI
ncbi:Uncharacterised protein [uncultured archaeon]|nr:Uncharacterised protein [uncultured archaeon]